MGAGAPGESRAKVASYHVVGLCGADGDHQEAVLCGRLLRCPGTGALVGIVVCTISVYPSFDLETRDAILVRFASISHHGPGSCGV